MLRRVAEKSWELPVRLPDFCRTAGSLFNPDGGAAAARCSLSDRRLNRSPIRGALSVALDQDYDFQTPGERHGRVQTQSKDSCDRRNQA